MKIDLTETEIIHLMDALDARIEDLDDTLTFGDDPTIQDQIGEMRDLAADLFEAVSRQDDGWGDPADLSQRQAPSRGTTPFKSEPFGKKRSERVGRLDLKSQRDGHDG